MTEPAAFAAIRDSWAPEPVRETDIVTARPIEMFAALLDRPVPAEVPPLWHWFLFPPVHRSSDLDADGHPRDAAFTPPLPDRRRMWGGGRLTVTGPLRFGDRVERVSRLGGLRVTRGGSGWLLVVTVVHELIVDGRVRVREEQDIVYRRAADMTGRRDRSGTPVAGEWRLRWRPDPVALFRFSALTANAHRIHYDRPYATEVEGYPGLVVHGPLLALLMLELPRRYAPDRPVSSFAWRAHAPLFDTDTVLVAGTETGLAAGSVRTGAAVTGSIILSG